MRNSLYDRKTAAQTDLFDLIKMNNVSSNVNQPEPRDPNKRTKVIAVALYTVNNQIHSSGTD